ncbi:MAG: hypothetical protein AAF529_14600 [Pseudomonadota bacterium]
MPRGIYPRPGPRRDTIDYVQDALEKYIAAGSPITGLGRGKVQQLRMRYPTVHKAFAAAQAACLMKHNEQIHEQLVTEAWLSFGEFKDISLLEAA